MFPTLNLLSDLYLSVDSQMSSCIGVFRCILPLWSVPAFHFGMSGETNSCTLSISRTRSRCCNLRNQRLVQLLFCSTLGVTLFYIERSCLASWRTWWSDALTLPYPSISELLGLENVEDEYRCGNRIFLANDIVLTSKDCDVILSMIGNLIIKPSLTALPSPFVQVPTLVNELDSCRNSNDHIFPLWEENLRSHSSLCPGAWRCSQFLRILTSR